MPSVGLISFCTQSARLSVQNCFLQGQSELISGNLLLPSIRRNNSAPVAKNTIDKIERIITALSLFASLSLIFSGGVFVTAFTLSAFSKAVLFASAKGTALLGLLIFGFVTHLQSKLQLFQECCTRSHIFDFPNTVHPIDIR